MPLQTPQIELIGIPEDVLPLAGLFANSPSTNPTGSSLLNQPADSICESIRSRYSKLILLKTILLKIGQAFKLGFLLVSCTFLVLPLTVALLEDSFGGDCITINFHLLIRKGEL